MTQMTLADVGYFLIFCLLVSSLLIYLDFHVFYYERFWKSDDGYSRNTTCALT